MTSCAYCIGCYLNIVNVIVETNYLIMYLIYSSFLVKVIRSCFCKGKFRRKQISEALDKRKLQNE